MLAAVNLSRHSQTSPKTSIPRITTPTNSSTSFPPDPSTNHFSHTFHLLRPIGHCKHRQKLLPSTKANTTMVPKHYGNVVCPNRSNSVCSMTEWNRIL